MSRGAEFLSCVKSAFAAPDAQTRARAFAQLRSLAAEDPNTLAALAVQQFEEKQNSISDRVLVATFLAGCLVPRDAEGPASIWTALRPEAKTAVKETCLRNLIDSSDKIMNIAASLTASTFAVDCVTDHSWDQLLPALTENVVHSDLAVQKAAVTTLGHICHELNQQKIKTISEARIDSLLTGICKGLQQLNELTETAIQAFDDSVHYLRLKINDEQIADFVMELLIKLLREVHQKAKDGEAERKLIYCLLKITKILFSKLGKYHAILFEEVCASFKTNSAKIFAACDDFFLSVLKAETKLGTSFTANFWRRLMEANMERLLSPFPELDEEEASTDSSILDIMCAINKLHGPTTVEPLKSFVLSQIDSAEERKKAAALIVLESLVDIPRKELVAQFMNSGFPGIINFLQTGSVVVKKHSLRILLKIVKCLPEIFFFELHFIKVNKALMMVMEASDESEEVAKVQAAAASVFSEATTAAARKSEFKTLLKSNVDQLFDLICKASLKSKHLHVIDSYFSIIFDYVQKIIEPKLLGEYASLFVKFLKQVLAAKAGFQLQITEFLFINLTVIITHIKKKEVRFFSSSAMNHNLFLKELFETVAGVFNSQKEIISEGLMLMATIVTSDVNWGKAAVAAFLKDYVVAALKDCQNSDVFKAAVESVSLCCKAYENTVEPFIVEIYPYFLTLLRNDSINKELKITVFFALSDFVLHVPTAAAPLLAETLQLAELAMQASLHFQQSDQEDLVEYAEIFKETLIDFYLCLIHGVYMKRDDCDKVIESSMKKTSEFIKLTSNESLNPQISFLLNCLGLIVDFYSKKKNQSLVDFDTVKLLCQLLYKHRATDEVANTLEYASKYFAL